MDELVGLGASRDAARDAVASRLGGDRRDGGGPVELLPPNRPVWRVFAAACTQWRFAGMGGLAGLDFGGVKIAADALGIELDEDLLARLRIIEGEAIRQMKAKR